MLQDSTIARLRDDLLSASFTLDAVTERLGQPALAALARNTTRAALDALRNADDPQATLIRLWVLGLPVSATAAARALTCLPDLREAGLIQPATSDQLAATVELKPYGWDTFQGWVCCDQTPLDHAPAVPRDDFVLGGSPASTTLAQLTVRRPAGSALDLGTGSGIQALHLAEHTERIVSTDVNPRALDLARITLHLSLNPPADVDLRLGSLYEPVANETFDLIVSNPPYVMTPPTDSHLLYREGGFTADGLMRAVVTGAPAHLNEGGLLQIVGNWAITASQPWEDHIASWIAPTGCDALVLRRETLDIYEYVELWLADAGITDSAQFRDTYRRWVSYFDTLGIVAVGMGWISLRRGGHDTPQIRIEDWPNAVVQPVGPDVGRFFDAIDLSRATDDSLAATRLCLRDDVIQETYGRPGAPDPEHIVLRQTTGLCRATECDTPLAAVLGACDGTLPLGPLIDATASLLDTPPAPLRATLIPRIRPLILQDFLRGQGYGQSTHGDGSNGPLAQLNTSHPTRPLEPSPQPRPLPQPRTLP